MGTKMKNAIAFIGTDEERIVTCKDMEKSDYDTNYRGHLTCKNGCDARIKFTQRKNNVKFFSTWNKEGDLHQEGCPYSVEYIGKIGRKRLEAFYKARSLDDDTILRRLKWKMKQLLQQDDKKDSDKHHRGSLDVEHTGKRMSEMPIASEDGEEGGSKPHLDYANANLITKDDVGCIKTVIGIIRNVQLVSKGRGETYAYINLKTDDNKINMYFPQAFYESEDAGGVKEFERYINSVKEYVEKKDEDVYVIAYGDIRTKRKLGLNVNVIAPKRILVDGMTYFEMKDK